MSLKVTDTNDTSFNNGPNKFVWDMRWTQAALLKVAPFAKPGTYKAKLEVDGDVQISLFELKINPNEPYTTAQIDEKYAYWMDIYQLSIDTSNALLKAMSVEAEVLEKAKGNDKLKAPAEAVSAAMADYKITFVPKGRTLAEIINQPARLFS